MAITQTIESLIVSQPGVKGGRPIIANSSVTVRTIVGYYKLGLTPEEIVDDMNIGLAGVYAALAYYHLNRDEIEEDIVTNSEEAIKKAFGYE
ncbi:MAG: DUF433 domain-containing protein [Chloroflexota bacterium]